MRYPPLNSLRAFEAAGRHQSFLVAAEELHVSSTSISRFIKQLEQDLKHPLFIRHANGVTLTEVGEKYLQDIQPALQKIVRVSDKLRETESKRKLTIVSMAAIAETWLINHLWTFHQQHNDIEINLVVEHKAAVAERLKHLDPDESVVVLDYSRQKSQNVEHFAMPKDKLTLVCNHELVKTLKTPQDIFKHTLLLDGDWTDDWLEWLEAADLLKGLGNQIPENHQIFERYSMVINATVAGAGVAIGHTALLEHYLQSGVLVAPFDISTNIDKQFYASIANNTQKRAVKQFINWFIGEDHFSV